MAPIADRIASISDDVPLQDREALGRGLLIAERVVQNARQATRYWSLWESINNRLEPERQLRQSLEWFQPNGFGEVRQALALGAILAALRVSEDPGKSEDRMSACVLSSLLNNPGVVSILTNKQWLSHPSLDDPVARLDIAEQGSRIVWLTNNVPCGWAKGYALPVEGNLHITRQKLRAVRDKLIAHSLDTERLPATEFPHLLVNDVREGVRSVLAIARCCSLVFLGHTSGLDESTAQTVAQMDSFWECFEHGVVSMHSAWKREAKASGAIP